MSHCQNEHKSSGFGASGFNLELDKPGLSRKRNARYNSQISVGPGSMAHSLNCKLRQSYRQWHSFQTHTDTNRPPVRVVCVRNAVQGAIAKHVPNVPGAQQRINSQPAMLQAVMQLLLSVRDAQCCRQPRHY